jgi:STE24 endopeptidase
MSSTPVAESLVYNPLVSVRLTFVALLLAAPGLERAPLEGTWGEAAFDLERYFAPGEVEAWQSFRGQHRTAGLVALGLDLATCLLFLGGPGRWLWRRLSRRRDRRAGRAGRLLARVLGPDWRAALLFAYAYFAVGVVLDLPLSIWHELINLEVGLSTTTPGLWAVDFLKGLLIGATLFTLLVTGLYGLVRRFPRRFWLILAAPVAVVTVVYGVVSPYGTRLYQKVRPLESTRHADPALVERLRRLARTSGVTLEQIKITDTSRRSRAFGAYLAGVGPSRELVLSDTLLESASADEIAVVVAHELGHHDEADHTNLILAALGLIVLLGLLSLVLRAGARLMRLDGPGHMRTLPLVGITALLLFNLALPLRNARSRERERRADRHALILTGDPEAFISIQVKLARRNREDVAPSRWVELWYFGHPPAAERIGTALWYRGWLERRWRSIAPNGAFEGRMAYPLPQCTTDAEARTQKEIVAETGSRP